ncbi:unnamed protein product [Prorocentrum cordatum]|uniref:SET domain-containing protein n=1 Tax=Prorocentrum cordatum TaxID=2364126 RepID=A0ABN9QEE2_9DINO|nr:unnamed protein product [Polarella glacialis]
MKSDVPVPRKRPYEDVCKGCRDQVGVDATRARVHGLVSWLRENGANIDGLECRDDGLGGLGMFATKSFAAGAEIASIPAALVFTTDAARATKLGAAAAALGAQEELVLWIYMAHGRSDPEHPWHPYLKSLAASQPDPTSWSRDALAPLRATPIMRMVTECKAMLGRDLARLQSRLPITVSSSEDQALEGLSLQALLWARGMHLSRCFPAELATSRHIHIRPDCKEHCGGRGGAKGDSVGCLLPFLDMANHKAGHQISWEASDGRVAFKTVSELHPGDEIHNNYGMGRSNEDFLFYYGFAELNADWVRNVITGIVLVFDVSVETALSTHKRLLEEHIPCGLMGSSTLRIGPFDLVPTVVQSATGEAETTLLPHELVRALRIVGPDREGQEPDQPSAEALAVLHASLLGSLAAARLAPEAASPDFPERAAYVKAYCNGRCHALEAALSEAEFLLGY